jgi:hypothetical protein
MPMKCLLIFLFVLCLALTGVPAFADTSIPIQNASFETSSSVLGPGGFNFLAMPGWTITGSDGSFQPTSANYILPLPDGITVAWSNGGTISQTLTGTSLQPNSTYTLTVAVGHRLGGYVANYTIQLDAGSTVLATVSASNSSITPGTFMDVVLTYTTGSTVTPGDLAIVLITNGSQINFDNVRASVPEPSSLSMAVMGLAFFGLLSRFLRS